MYQLILGDCRELSVGLADQVDCIITDPPYGLSFMGKGWDHGVPGVEYWSAFLRVAKPGAHLLAFGGTRTFHRLAVAIEDAGWEIRDCIAWVYGSGFPKSHNLKDDWQGWGTALKPAFEPIIVARKPFACTVAQNVLTWGTGAINVDGCRVATGDDLSGGTFGGVFGAKRNPDGSLPKAIGSGSKGRWPANFIHDGSDEVMRLMPETKSGGANGNRVNGPYSNSRTWNTSNTPGANITSGLEPSSGSAARFFYCAKASKRDRDEGCEGNTHPTVKPTDLMRYLCRLVTPPGGIILDPFMGSGSTGKAAIYEGFSFIGMELDPTYLEIAKCRIEFAVNAMNEYIASGRQPTFWDDTKESGNE